ncbi:GntP family permease [Desertivibrio insolitus]|uniref:GntP family permease n=1 Tax=Herbiconiux sp. SYSU D00978 TaxID=2812562 RepID=UPI001A964331|nr:GntP family permease [Herbiconiux sp. SYSU D00978]
MTPEIVFSWQLPTWGLLTVAVAAIGVLLLLIIKFKLHAFLALIIVSFFTAVATGISPGQIVGQMTTGFGNTLATVALLVGLGAMLGRLIETSGGAQVLTDRLVARFGEKRAPLALSVASLLMGFPIFFDAGLVVMLPIIFAVGRRIGGSLLRYAFPAAVAFSVMHIYVPPHPGPVTATGIIGADLGLVLLFGLIIAIPTWYITGYLYGTWLGKRYDVPIPAILSGGQAKDDAADEFRSNPGFGTTVFLLALPLVLILMNTGLNALAGAGIVSLENGTVQVLRMLGETPIALTITVIAAILLLGWKPKKRGNLIETITDSALGPVCSLILITGAGGMFGYILRTSGIGTAIADSLNQLGLPVIIAGFIIAAIVRVAQGSATVALTTAAALVAAVVAADTSLNQVELAAIVLALAAGSVFAGHVNDSGFWLISRFFGMSTTLTLRTWTVGQALVGVVGFVFAFAIYLVGSAF